MSLKEVKSELNKSKSGSKIKLSSEEEKDLLSKYKQSKKITKHKLKTQMSRKSSYFPQPIRTQPSMEVFTTKENDYSIAQRIVKLTAKDVKKWGDTVIADVKYDGIRAMLVIDPKKEEVRVLSRNLITLKKFEKKYSKDILKGLSKAVKDKTVLDVELYAVGKNGEILPGTTVSGWARNPEQEKYNEIRPSVEAFDIVVLNSKDVRDLPLKYRKRLLEASLKEGEHIIESADTRMMNNSSRLIDWLFLGKVKKRGFEGLVLKDPNSKYFYNKPKDNAWRKVKAVDTLDLRLEEVSAYPEGKKFKFYKHWNLGTEDSDIQIKVDKGIKDANMGEDYYISFTKQILNEWKKNKQKGEKMVSVRSELVPVYGMKKVPERITLKNGPIIELFVEGMSDQLQPTGQKVVRVRSDKSRADSIKDIVELRDYLRGVNRK